MKRHKYSLSNYKLLTGYQGPLIPIGLTEVLPGDSMQMTSNIMIRMSPLLSPVMHPVHMRIHHWFVPHRLVWEEWEDFITGGPDGMDASVFPTMDLTLAERAETQLADYYGIPRAITGESGNLQVSALPFRGYGMIWNEWYRDQDLQTELTVSEASGADTTTNRLIKRVAWEKDYFTTARPWPQKGPDVTIPVLGNGTSIQAHTAASPTDLSLNINSGSFAILNGYAGASSGLQLSTTTPAAGINIQDLREGLAIQRYEEARARYGSRYTEYLRYLGVKSSDARLQRPEYLGGGKQTVQFSEVLQTAPGDDSFDDSVGAMKGHGIGAMRSNRWRRFFEEHGYIHSFVSIKPRTMYMNGLDRTWNRRTKEDFFQKELQHIGQQEILNKEVYANLVGNAPLDDTWGYQDRYAEYRRGNVSNVIAGRFSSTLDYWHMARKYTSTPALNDSFVTANPTSRIYADTTEPDFLMMANNSIQARRMVSPSTGSHAF